MSQIYVSDQIRSDQSLSLSDSLQPHELQHARPPCPSPTPRVHWDSRPSSRWCHSSISSSVVPFSSCRQSLPASESFPMSQLFPWGGQSTGVSALASFLPKKSQGWSPSEWTDLRLEFINKGKKESRSVVSNYLQPHGLSLWNSPDQNSGVGSLPSPGDLPNPGIEPRSSTLQVDSLPAEP